MKQYILPRLPHAKRKRTAPTADSGSPSAPTPAASSAGNIAVSLKPMKPGNPSVTLRSQAPTTSVFDLKSAYAAQAGGLDPAKIKLLRAKKPVADSKSLGDLLAEGGDEGAAEKDIVMDFAVMVMGGGGAATAAVTASSPAAEKDKMDVDPAPVAQGPSGAEVLRKEEFWDDLGGFLMQRVRDEDESARLVKIFKDAWESSNTRP